VLKFGPIIARRLRLRRPRPSNRWHLDETVVRIAGERMYLWRAVDHEGEVLDMPVQRRRDSRAAFRRLRLSCPHEQGFGATIGPRTRISLYDDTSARCSASNRLDPLGAS
jgi:hypothetical protein